MTDAPTLVTPAALAGIAPLATSTARTIDGEFTTRVYAGPPSRVSVNITVVTNLDGEGFGEPYGTSLAADETPQVVADRSAESWVRVRGAALPAPAVAALDELRAAAADHPQHLAFADRLIEVARRTPLSVRWDAVNEAATDRPRGVSEAVADKITVDIEWIFVDSFTPAIGRQRVTYVQHRARTAARASRRVAARRSAAPTVIAERLAFLR